MDPFAFEQAPLGVPREEDDDAPGVMRTGRLEAEPFRLERSGDARLFADALRPDDDVRQVEVDVRKRRQQLGVEARRAFVMFPTVTCLDELVEAIVGQRRDQSRQIAVVLGDRVPLPQLADLVVELGRDLAAEQFDDGVVLDVLELGQRTSSAIVRKATGSCVATSSVVAPDPRHVSRRSAIRSRGPTSATSSTSPSGTAATA